MFDSLNLRSIAESSSGISPLPSTTTHLHGLVDFCWHVLFDSQSGRTTLLSQICMVWWIFFDMAKCCYSTVRCIRPYHVENTSSRPITEVKQHRAALVLGWVTAWEYAVLYTFLYRPQNCYLTALQNLYQVPPRARVAQSVER